MRFTHTGIVASQVSLRHLPLKMEQTGCRETSVFKINLRCVTTQKTEEFKARILIYACYTKPM
jgi:hypothetical protein